ncbi:MAG: rRNA maturation RNase YbeY [bacterium]|jgi:probable rRNA maturation factor|nr:rRNA maturation RNase YbeY [bacterium]
MITAELNQSRLKGGQRLPFARLQEVLNACARGLKIKKEAMVSIAFISPAQMKKLNHQWRGKNKLTDVLSFELDEGIMRGEILLSYERAVKQARELGHSTRDELWFLIVHGVLHVWGHDHETPKDSKKMFPLQTKILDSLGIDSRI